jgi:DNA-directed RNA polymerase subunit RPC12/RpoP
LKKPTICRYCGGIIRLVPAADVYGSSTERLGMQNEYLYQCQNCNARVGTRVLRGRSAMWRMRFCASSASKPIRCSTLTGRSSTSAERKPISGWHEN